MNSPVEYELALGEIIKLAEDLAEVVVSDGLEINQNMVNEYHQWITDNLSDSCLLLINKKNAYTYSFEAQQSIATLARIKAMAVVVYSKISELTTRDLSRFPRDQHWNLQIFYDRSSALDWLQSQR